MEKKKMEHYNPGYGNPDPFAIGRWYERVTQEKIDEFNRKEEERKRRTENKPRTTERMQDEDDDFMGDIAYFFSMFRGDT